MARTIIEQLRYLSTYQELMKHFKKRYSIAELPELYFRMSVLMRIFLGERVGKI